MESALVLGGAVQHPVFGFGVVKELTSADRVTAQFTIGMKILMRAFVTPVEHNKTTKLIGCVGTPAKTTDVDVPTFVEYLNETGFHLEVYAFSPEQAERVRAEYRDWTGTELPEKNLKIYDGAGYSREWRLNCPYSDDMPCSTPIIEGGSIGRGHPSETPHGLRRGNTVGFYYSEMIEELVRAGLRA